MDIKIEIEFSTFCNGCLSSDRRLTTVHEELKQLFYLISACNESSRDCCSQDLELCWECVAVLKKISSFQNQVQTAQYELQQYVPFCNGENNTLVCLSRLSCTHINRDVHIYKYQEISDTKNTELLPKYIENYKNSYKNVATEPESVVKIDIANTDICDRPVLLGNIKKEKNDDDFEETKDEFDTNLYDMNHEPDDHFDNPDIEDTKIYDTEGTIEQSVQKDESPKKQCVRTKKRYVKRVKLKENVGYMRIDGEDDEKKQLNDETVDGESDEHSYKKPARISCPTCGKDFKKKVNMNNHYNLVHLKVTRHYCPACDKYFLNSYALHRHDWSIHQKKKIPKNKICDICGRGFSDKRILDNHRRTHTGERPYKCPHCTASFAQSITMKTHQRTQHKNIESCTE